MSGGSHVSRTTFGGAESEISGGSAPPLPSPASAGAALVSPETLSRHSSPPPLPPHPSHQPAPSCSSHRVHMESPMRYIFELQARRLIAAHLFFFFWHVNSLMNLQEHTVKNHTNLSKSDQQFLRRIKSQMVYYVLPKDYFLVVTESIFIYLFTSR